MYVSSPSCFILTHVVCSLARRLSEFLMAVRSVSTSIHSAAISSPNRLRAVATPGQTEVAKLRQKAFGSIWVDDAQEHTQVVCDFVPEVSFPSRYTSIGSNLTYFQST